LKAILAFPHISMVEYVIIYVGQTLELLTKKREKDRYLPITIGKRLLI